MPSYGTNSKAIPSSPRQGECRVIPISVSHFQAMHCPKGVQESPQTSYGVAEVHRHQARNLHEQHVSDGQLEATNSREGLYNSVFPGEPGVCHQQQKICPNSLKTNHVSRDDGGFTVHEIKTSRKEDQQDQNQSMAASGHPKYPSSISSSISDLGKLNAVSSVLQMAPLSSHCFTAGLYT